MNFNILKSTNVDSTIKLQAKPVQYYALPYNHIYVINTSIHHLFIRFFCRKRIKIAFKKENEGIAKVVSYMLKKQA